MSIQALNRLRVLSASDEERKLKQDISLRSQYEKLQDAIEKARNNYSDAKRPREAFQAWKKAHPGYPTQSLETLQKRLRNMNEKTNPDARKERKEGEKTHKENQNKSIALEKRLDTLLDKLHETRKKEYDLGEFWVLTS